MHPSAAASLTPLGVFPAPVMQEMSKERKKETKFMQLFDFHKVESGGRGRPDLPLQAGEHLQRQLRGFLCLLTLDCYPQPVSEVMGQQGRVSWVQNTDMEATPAFRSQTPAGDAQEMSGKPVRMI